MDHVCGKIASLMRHPYYREVMIKIQVLNSNSYKDPMPVGGSILAASNINVEGWRNIKTKIKPVDETLNLYVNLCFAKKKSNFVLAGLK